MGAKSETKSALRKLKGGALRTKPAVLAAHLRARSELQAVQAQIAAQDYAARLSYDHGELFLLASAGHYLLVDRPQYADLQILRVFEHSESGYINALRCAVNWLA